MKYRVYRRLADGRYKMERLEDDDTPMSPSMPIRKALKDIGRRAARENSRDGKMIELEDGVSYKKWCALCGAEFETVNASRLTCSACQDRVFAEEEERARNDAIRNFEKKRLKKDRRRRDKCAKK